MKCPVCGEDMIEKDKNMFWCNICHINSEKLSVEDFCKYIKTLDR